MGTVLIRNITIRKEFYAIWQEICVITFSLIRVENPFRIGEKFYISVEFP